MTDQDISDDGLYRSFCDDLLRARVGPEAETLALAHRLSHDPPPDVLVELLIVACRVIIAAYADFQHAWIDPARRVIVSLGRRRLTVGPTSMVRLVDLCASIGPGLEHFLPKTTVLGFVTTPLDPAVRDALHMLRAFERRGSYADSRRLVARIDGLLGEGPGPLEPGGAWSARVLADIDAFEPGLREAWGALVLHLRSGTSTDPTARWTRALTPHLDAVGRPAFVERTLGWLGAGPLPEEASTPQVPERDADFLKGFVWALGTIADAAVSQALGDLAEQCLRKVPNFGAVSTRVGQASIRALARQPHLDPVIELVRLRTRVRYAKAMALVNRALADAAAREGLSLEELDEIAVATFGLDAKGALKRPIGAHVAQLQVDGDAVHLRWRTDSGRMSKSVPADVRTHHATALVDVKKTAKAVTAALAVQRARLEELLQSDRRMPLHVFRVRYLEHALVGGIARRVIWRYETGSRSALGLAVDGVIAGVDDAPLDWLSAETTVQAWHPLGTAADEILAWRACLERRGVVQPFAQAHRELYVVRAAAPAIAADERFAGSVLRQYPLAALCRLHGWRYLLQGDWDSGGGAMRLLSRWNLQVRFAVEPPRDLPGTPNGIHPTVVAGAVTFLRDVRPMPLADVPPLAFSEAMRDVGLFVAACA